jgi:hypothetical protein
VTTGNHNGPDLVQAFPKKWWVESNFMAPNLPLPLWLKGSGCHYNSILPFPLEDCSMFGNFVITLINDDLSYAFTYSLVL